MRRLSILLWGIFLIGCGESAMTHQPTVSSNLSSPQSFGEDENQHFPLSVRFNRGRLSTLGNTLELTLTDIDEDALRSGTEAVTLDEFVARATESSTSPRFGGLGYRAGNGRNVHHLENVRISLSRDRSLKVVGTLSTDVSTQSVAQTGDLGSGVFVVTSRQPTNGPTVVTVTFLSDQPGPFAINDLYWVTYLDCIEIPYDIKGLMSSSDQSAFPMRIQLPKAVLNVLDNCESSVPPHHQAEVSVNQLETVSIGKRRDNAQHISIEATLVVEDNVPFYVDKLRFEWVLDPETTNAMIPVEYNGIVSGYKYPPIEVTLPGPLYDEHS